MDGELMDLASAFDDNPADAITGEDDKVVAPVKEEVVVVEPTDDEVEAEEGDDQENGDESAESDDPDLDLDLDGEEADEGKDAVAVLKDDTPIELVIDGAKVTKTFAELKAEAQKYAGAEKRFEEAAAIRKDAETRLAVLPEREKQLGQVLEYYIAQSAQFLDKQPNWEQLIAEDPQKYLAERHAWEKKQQENLQARQIQTELQRRNAEQEQASKAQRVAEERTKLLGAIPEWQDPAKAAEGARAIDQYLRGAGIPAEMLGDIDHHQVLVIARKAMLYDQAIAKQKAARETGAQRQKPNQQAQPKAARVERPGAAAPLPTQSHRTQVQRMNAAKAFKQAPSVDTLASLFE
jgi:hypothetical protein